MKIAIDARLYDESGIGRYIRNLISQLEIVDKENDYYVILPTDRFKKFFFKNKKWNKEVASFGWYGLSEQIKLPPLLKRFKPDLVHFPHFNVPLAYRGNFIVTIHDLIHQHFRMRRATMHDPLTYKIKQLGYKTIFDNAVSKAKKIIVPSNYVKKLLNDKGVDNNKIVVTYEAVDDKILSLEKRISASKMNTVLKKFGIGRQYLFYVGNAHPHKNVEGLIEAYLFVKKKNPELQLVLSGNDHYFWQRIKKENKYGGIIYTGFVTDEELVSLYKNAVCFILPSFEEGFGIPLLEAMACDCPIISSSNGSLTEIGGKAALYFNPNKTKELADKIEQMVGNKKLRSSLIENGRQRVELFSWKTLAQQTLEVYRKCV